MKEQLEMKLSDIDIKEVNEIDEKNNEEYEENDTLIYKKRAKLLLKNIANYEGYEGIQMTKEGEERLCEATRYIYIALGIQIIDELKMRNRKQIKISDVDKALDKILNKASGVDKALELLRDNMEVLLKLNTGTCIARASEFINYRDGLEEEC